MCWFRRRLNWVSKSSRPYLTLRPWASWSRFDPPAHTIASFGNTDFPLIRKVAATGKPTIVSTGMAGTAELEESIRAAREEDAGPDTEL